MGNMASEIQARMREDGIDPSERFVPGESDGPVPNVDVPPTATPDRPAGSGNEGGAPVPPPVAAPPAGASNTDTSQAGQEPGPIPYARFKEVNDRYSQLKDFESLVEYGYTPDHLSRLASFEAGWLRDPVGTVKALVDDLDLPSEAKSRIVESLGVQAPDASGDGGDDGDDGQNSSGLSAEDRELLEWARQRRARDEQETRNQQLDTVVNIWKAKDSEDKLKSPKDRAILTYISTAASLGNHRTYADLADAARKLWLEDRDEILGGAVQRSRDNGNPPPALPDSAVLPAPAQRPRTLAEANKLVKAALERGEELPRITGG